jgi:predicted anti-sigma-YlaC factor YlaD
MDEHVQVWLEAYHDGELHGRRLKQVEEHLARCAECRSEMDRLGALSALLQENPAPSGLTPPDRFAAQVGLRLPRRQKGSGRQRMFRAGWQVPAGGLVVSIRR